MRSVNRMNRRKLRSALGGTAVATLAIPVLGGAGNSPPLAPDQLAWVQSYRPEEGHTRQRLMLGKLDNPGAATEVTISGCTGTRNGCFIDDPAISPDGRRIAFTMVGLNSQGTKDGSYNIHIVDVISSRMWQVTFTTADSWSPSYSSEGRWLAFDQGGFIYKADLCGGGWQVGRRLREGEHPSWSPGGADIVFESRGDILIMDNDGRNVRQLVTQGRNRDPVWMKPGNIGSKGALIAFSTTTGLKMIDPRGRNLTPLSGRAADRSPDWPANIPLFVVYETTGGAGSEIWYGNNMAAKKLTDGRSPSTGYPIGEPRTCPR
jgi:hypothetical protein